MNDKALLLLVELLYDAVATADRWPEFLEQFADILEGTHAGLVRHDTSRDTQQLLFTNVDAKAVTRYESYYAARNPWLLRFGIEHFKPGHIYNSNYMNMDNFVFNSEWFHDWGRPNGVFHSLGATLQKSATSASYVVAMRPHTTRAFDRGHSVFLSRLVPHLRRALELQQRLAKLEATEISLDHFPLAVLAVDREGYARYWNRKADHLLQVKDGLFLLRGRLNALDGRESSSLRALVRALTLLPGVEEKRPNLPERLTVSISRPGKRPLSIQMYPLLSSLKVLRHLSPAVLLIIVDPESVPQADEALLASAFGLTPRESRVAAALSQGKNVDEVADELHMSRNTARAHLRSIFVKLDVQRQSELVRLVMMFSK